MPRFKKQILTPGTFTVALRDRSGEIQRDSQGQPITISISFSPERIRGFHDTQRRMLAAGLSAPLPLEHQIPARPVTEEEKLARRVAFNAGFVTDSFLDSDGALWNEIEVNSIPVNDHFVTDPAEIEIFLKNNVKYVSPWISKCWVDGQGREWRDAITHLALTPTPIFMGQKPFGETFAMSTAAGDFAMSLPAQWGTPRNKAMNPNSFMGQIAAIRRELHDRWSGRKARRRSASAVALSAVTEKRLLAGAAQVIRDRQAGVRAGLDLARLAGFATFAKDHAGDANVDVVMSEYLHNYP